MKKLVFVLAVLAALLLTACGSYRLTMRAARIDVAGDTAYITVFGKTDVYSLNGGAEE